MEPAFIRVRDLAVMLGVSRAKAHEVVRTGRVESLFLDRARLIPIESARAYVDKLKREAGLATAV